MEKLEKNKEYQAMMQKKEKEHQAKLIFDSANSEPLCLQ